MAAIAIAQPIVEQQSSNRIHRYQVNVTQAISKMKHVLVKCMATMSPTKLFDSLIDLFVKTIEMIRPDRSYPHQKRKSMKRRFHMAYKPLR